MTNKELHYLTGLILTIDQHPELKEKISVLINETEINWNKFVWNSSNNLILQTIYVKFRDHDILKLIPPDLSDYLKEIYELNLTRNQQILLQIDDLNKAFEINNIRPIYFKGAGNLLDNLYKDTGERLMADIDLLVKEEDFLRSAKVLEGMGYRNSEPFYEDLSQAMHYPTLHKEGLPAEVEIHRTPVMFPWSEKLSEAMVSGEKKEATDGRFCDVPSDRHKVFINFIHSQLSNGGSISGLVSLRDLYDLYLLADKVDLNKILEEIPYKRRANSYFFLASKLFERSEVLNPPKTIFSGIYLLHFNFNLSSRFYYHTFRLAREFYDLIFVRYLGIIPRLLIDRKTRKTVYRKMNSLEWYKSHVASYRERFR